MGTPEIARKSLQRLYDDGREIAAVFTGFDKPRGRGMKLSPCPVKELALIKGTPVFHADALGAQTISGLSPDLIAVVAYGRLLRSDILKIPPLGCINIHGSILPKYRGAAPIQHAILNGETQTGVTSMYMSEGMDEGDIIFTKTTQIAPEETSADLFERLGDMGAELLSETIEAIEQGSAPRTPQDHAQATVAPMLRREMSPVDFDSEAYAIKCKVRALIPWPVATMEYKGKTIKIFSVDITDERTGERPGTIISESKRGLEVACKDGTVIITRLQAPGGKIMDAADYLRGRR